MKRPKIQLVNLQEQFFNQNLCCCSNDFQIFWQKLWNRELKTKSLCQCQAVASELPALKLHWLSISRGAADVVGASAPASPFESIYRIHCEYSWYTLMIIVHSNDSWPIMITHAVTFKTAWTPFDDKNLFLSSPPPQAWLPESGAIVLAAPGLKRSDYNDYKALMLDLTRKAPRSQFAANAMSCHVAYVRMERRCWGRTQADATSFPCSLWASLATKCASETCSSKTTHDQKCLFHAIAANDANVFDF